MYEHHEQITSKVQSAQTIYRVPPILLADLEKLAEQTRRFKSGDISAVEYRSFRVPQGVYEQREAGTFMLRVRLPAGGILPHQMRTLAAVARKYGSGRVHVTTRQDVQIHDVLLEGIHPALVELHRGAGLSAKGGGGNTVRNITACPNAGVCEHEAFDVSPYVVALTEFMLADPASFRLPRKYKIAFSGCSADCVGATVNDLGFIAKHEADGPGFAVYAGGGMGPHARVAELLEEFVPAADIFLVAEAVKRVFDKHGNRKNKQRARLRYLVEEKGLQAFKELYTDELARLREEDPPAPELRELPHRVSPDQAAVSAPGDGFDIWRARNVCAQKQNRYYLVHVPLFLGELPADLLEYLSHVIEAYGEGMVRTTPSQNLVIRWVSEAALPELHHELAALDLADSPPPVLRETIACTGAATCKLGICRSQGLADAIRSELELCGLDLKDAVDLRLHINGCPNCCGRHPIASIGLFGAARRVGDRLVPYYVVQTGGRMGKGRTRLTEGREMVPARKVPQFLVEFLSIFRKSVYYPDFEAFLESEGREIAARTAAKHREVRPFTEDEGEYFDWGEDKSFSLADRGPGECSAGVFDLIRVDLGSARQALEEGDLLSATQLAARALLITRGEEAKDAADALRLFDEHFLDTGLVEDSLRDLITGAREVTQAQHDREGPDLEPNKVSALIAAVERLYENMDQSLRLAPLPQTRTRAEVEAANDIKIDREADLSGVTCPLNYVKTKLLLGQMGQGQILSVSLDEAGRRSVPQSAEKDGHEVLSVQEQGGRWRVIIRKG
ncbi:MAG: sulfurtransferase TusA family protein [Phycisphaerales bacterium]|nr:MAG: sulfurtransferase TusA family protein [Phycisphaerales bacterium]